MTNTLKTTLFITLMLSAIACDKNSADDYVDTDNASTEVVTDRNLEVSFETVDPNGEYSPSHILAVWVEKDDGTFVRSLKVRASERIKYLYTWKTSSKSDQTDAVTGATISRHTSHTIDWNLQDASQVDIVNGNYLIKLEMTDGNQQGAVSQFAFNYQDSIMSTSFNDATDFKNVAITYSHTIE